MTATSAAFEKVFVQSGLGTVLEAGSWTTAAGAVTSVRHLANENADSYTYHNRLLYRPASASLPADEIRFATTLATGGVLSLDRNVADTTVTTEPLYLFKLNIHPQWAWDALNVALDKNYFPNLEPLSQKPTTTLLADAGFQSTATTNYIESDADGGAATTFSKITTANSENVRTGVGSGRVLNGAAGGYIRQRFNVNAGQQVISWVCSRLDAGTNFQHALFDITGSAAIGDTLSHAQEAFMYTKREETIPTGCKVLEARYGGEGADDDVYLDAQHLYIVDNLYFPLDSSWEVNEFRAPKLMYLRFKGAQLASNVWNANASDLVYVPDEDYDLHQSTEEAHPYTIQFHTPKWFQYPIFIEGRRRHSDLAGTLDSSDWATDVKIDLDLWESRARLALFDDPRVQAVVPDHSARRRAADMAFKQAARRFVVKGVADQAEPFFFGGMPN